MAFWNQYCPNGRKYLANGYLITDMIARKDLFIVFNCVNIRTRKPFKAKIVNLAERMHKKINYMRNEASILSELSHPYITKVIDRFTIGKSMVLILEPCIVGDIGRMIQKGATFTYEQYKSIFYKLILTLKYCHDNEIAHRDIKPASIIAFGTNIVKLGNFGYATHVNEGEKLSDFSGNFYFKAPELHNQQKYDPFKSDIWSLGVTFYYIITGNIPWKGQNDSEIKAEIISADYEFPITFPDSFIKLIKRMIVVDPEKRASAEELLTDECFDSIKNDIIAKNKAKLAKKEYIQQHSE